MRKNIRDDNLMRTTRRKFLEELVAVSACSQMGMLWARPYNDTTSWDPFVEEITDTATYLRRKFRQDVTDRATGLGIAELDEAMKGIVAAGKAASESWRMTITLTRSALSSQKRRRNKE